MRDTFALLLVCAALVLLLAGCGPATAETYSVKGWENRIERFEDTDAGVVCWVYHDSYKGGLSCLPINQTKLGK